VSGATISRTFEQLCKGDTFASGGRTVSEEDVVSFAALTGDLDPAHLDGWSASAESGERTAPGALTLAYALGLLSLDAECAVALRGMTDVVFTRPVRVGDTLSVTGRVAELVPLDARTGLVTVVLLTANQNGKTVCRARAQTLWRRSPVQSQTDKEAR